MGGDGVGYSANEVVLHTPWADFHSWVTPSATSMMANSKDTFSESSRRGLSIAALFGTDTLCAVGYPSFEYLCRRGGGCCLVAFTVVLRVCSCVRACVLFTFRSGAPIAHVFLRQGVLHGTPRAVLGEDGGAVLRYVQLLHRQGVRKVSCCFDLGLHSRLWRGRSDEPRASSQSSWIFFVRRRVHKAPRE